MTASYHPGPGPDPAARAEVYLTLGQWDKAAASARCCLSQDPDHGPALVTLAQALMLDPHGDSAEAVRTAEQAVRNRPEAPQAWLVLSHALDALEWAGDDASRETVRRAVDAAGRAVRLAPWAAVTHRTLALICANAAYRDGVGFFRLRNVALSAARQAVQLDPNDPDNHATMAWAYHVAADHQGAELALREGLRIDPDGAYVRRIQGMVNLDNRHTTAAVSAFAGVLRQNPTQTDARDAIDRATAGLAMRAFPALGMMVLVVTGWVLVARSLLVQAGWLTTGREVALAAWVVGASACAGLVRHAVRICPWRQLWSQVVELNAHVALVVVPGMVGLADLVVAVSADPWQRPMLFVVVVLSCLAAYQLLLLVVWFRALYKERSVRAV